ncbi:MAG: hypothetical protein EOO16_27155 [Chitinophagaceae bacterium]|nr:MAG: hypothetical protein EOO16_27155 [Chitinophagaceae bacterium]
MKQEFTITIEQVTYQVKRIYHPELPLSYHIHFNDWHQHTVFRMRPDDSGSWVIVPMQLPGYVFQAEPHLRNAIEANEEAA